MVPAKMLDQKDRAFLTLVKKSFGAVAPTHSHTRPNELGKKMSRGDCTRNSFRGGGEEVRK